jgi:hypothetical protein
MSNAKFASITASLLARKGEAQPWGQPAPVAAPPSWRGNIRPAVPAAPPPQLRTAASAAPPPPLAGDRSCSVRMSAHDYERLGILAVKANVTRQQLLKDAVNQFLAAKAKDYNCACLGACDCSCSGTQ